MRFAILFCCAVLALVHVAQVAAGPVVVETLPANGARDVDPATSQIRVTFSEPMTDGSWSWCGGGYAYPEIAEAPYFEDEHTAVLPVRLEPQHTYVLSINCPAGMNFRSTDGKPAEPHVLRFTTTWDDSVLASADAGNQAAVDELRRLLAEHYSYAERTGWDWRAALEEERGFLLSASSAMEWGWRVTLFLEQFKDKHLYVEFPEDNSIRPHVAPGVYNGNVEDLERLVGPVERHGNMVWWSRREDLGYIGIHAWPGGEAASNVLHAFLDEMMDARVVIVDVRANGGGDELQARGAAARFLAAGEGGTYARNRIRDPSGQDGWSPWYDRTVAPAAADQHIGARVLLLQGNVCLSSNESFIKMMRLSPRVTTIGTTTGGSSARPQQYALPNGVGVTLPSWWSTLPDGTLLEGNGISADVEVDGDFTSGDWVLCKALEVAGGEEAPD